VRAINSAGGPSRKPAEISFVILAPFWQQWWVAPLLATGAGCAVYAAYRYRLAHMLRLERVRTRIATDLHDDIGASLSQIFAKAMRLVFTGSSNCSPPRNSKSSHP
jgi:hypothetical protein